MRLPYAVILALVLLSGAVEPARAQFQASAVPSDTQWGVFADRVAIAPDANAPIAGTPSPPLQVRPQRWASEAATLVAENQVQQVGPDKQSPKISGAPRGWLGVRIQDVTQDVADGLGLRAPGGVVVAGAIPGGPAEQAGLRRGDVILQIDGENVATMPSFVQRIVQAAPGKTVTLLLWRRGTQQSLTVRVGATPGVEGRSAQDLPARADDVGLNALLGISVERLSDEARSGHGIGAYVVGVVITQVQPTQKLLKVRDVVFEVDQVAVTTPEQLVRRVNTVRRMGRRSVLLAVVAPQGDTRYVAVSFSTTAPPAGPGPSKRSDGDALKALPQLEQLDTLK